MKAIGKIVALLLVICMAQQNTFAQISISVRIAPPALPIYTQPECPVDGYMWQPGYWAYDNVGGYYWVPGSFGHERSYPTNLQPDFTSNSC